MSYKAYWRVRVVLAFALVGFAGSSVWHFAASSERSTFEYAAVVFWVLGPPLWFFVEYLCLDSGWIGLPATSPDKAEALQSTRTYADYASKIWAAVLAAVLFLF